MRKILLSVAALLCMLTACTKNTNEWELVWSDEFDGEVIDTTCWSKIPRGTSDWDNYMYLSSG